MANSKEGIVQIDRLGASNYATWAFKMRMLLKSRDLWSAIEAPGPVDAKIDEKALAHIVLNVEDFHLAELEPCKTAKEAWSKLDGAYKASSTSRRLQLRRELTTLKKESSESVAKYVARARELRNALVAIGHEVKPDELVWLVLAGLPAEYAIVVSILESGDAVPDLDATLAKLLQVEQKLQAKVPDTDGGAALLGRAGGSGAGDWGARGRAGQSQGDRISNRDRTCWHCGQKGHIKADCFKLKREMGQEGPGSSRQAVAGAGVALVVSDLYDGSTWVIDSGASQHMTADASKMHNYSLLADDRTVTFGKGDKSTVMGVGDVQLWTDVEGQAMPVLLTNVLHVPGLKFNLLSVPQCVQKGAAVEFLENSCNISMHDVVLAVAEPGAAGLYVVKQFPMEQDDSIPVLAAVCSSAQLWHARFGHLGYDNLAKLVKSGMVTGMDVSAADIMQQKSELCEGCVLGKHSRDPFDQSVSRTVRQLELLHMDVLGPLEVESLGGSKYVATFLDDFSGLSVVRTIAHKSDVTAAVREVVQMLETQTGLVLKAVRTDRGGEYVNGQLRDLFVEKGVVHQTTAPYTPQQNGKAERLNRTLVERVRCMLVQSGQPKCMWAEAFASANFIRNRSPSAADDTKTPYELFFGKLPDVSGMRVWGCDAFVHVPKQLRKKLDPTSVKGVFVGYEANSKAYRVLVAGRIVVSRDVQFAEKSALMKHVDAGVDPVPPLVDMDDDVEAQVNVPVAGGADVALLPEPVADPEEFHEPEDAEELPEPEAAPAPRYPARARAKPGMWWMAAASVAQTAGKGEPQSFDEAMSAADSALWKKAMDEEIMSLHENNTWELCDLPVHAKAIPVKWLYKIKRDAAGNIERYKARLVAKGFMQREGVDFNEVYAPVSKHTSLRALLAVVSAEDLELHQLDIKTAFLNGELEEELYIVQPPGYEQGGKGTACRLKRALYGLRQAPRAWYTRLQKELSLHGFQPSEADPGLYVRFDKSGCTYLLVWVDDILVAGCPEAVQNVKDVLRASFDVRDLGEANFFLGMEVQRDRGSKKLMLSQRKFTAELLLKYNMHDANPRQVPLSPAVKLSRDGSEGLDTAVHGYGELVGSLLYLSVCTRPDIAFAVGALARYMSDPREQHWDAAKGVLRYLRGTEVHGLVFGGGSALAGFGDADYAGDVDTRRSTTGYVFVLNGAAISWSSRLQPTVAVSTAEAEYMAAAAAVKEALWLRKLLADLQRPLQVVQLYCDNQAALSLLKHPIASARSKHIDVVHHFARERVARGEVVFTYCQSQDMVADCMTKALPDVRFILCRDKVGVRCSL